MVVDVTRVSQSCGFAVPVMQYQSDRSQLDEWTERKGAEGLKRYQESKNKLSIDGLPALKAEPLVSAAGQNE
jgi:hypothetical protein